MMIHSYGRFRDGFTWPCTNTDAALRLAAKAPPNKQNTFELPRLQLRAIMYALPDFPYPRVRVRARARATVLVVARSGLQRRRRQASADSIPNQGIMDEPPQPWIVVTPTSGMQRHIDREPEADRADAAALLSLLRVAEGAECVDAQVPAVIVPHVTGSSLWRVSVVVSSPKLIPFIDAEARIPPHAMKPESTLYVFANSLGGGRQVCFNGALTADELARNATHMRAGHREPGCKYINKHERFVVPYAALRPLSEFMRLRPEAFSEFSPCASAERLAAN